MTAQELFRSLLGTFRQRTPGMAPWDVICGLSDDELDAYFRACGRLYDECPTNTSEHQIGGGVIRGWISQEVRRRRNCREFPAIFGPV